MRNLQILKDLFLLQERKEQLRIIKEYNIEVDGFNNITLDLLKKFEPKISEELTNKRNYKNIINKNLENSKRFNNKMDIYLDTDKIIEKHGKSWDKLLQIILKNNLGELSSEIIEILKEKNENKNSNNISIKNTELTEKQNIEKDSFLRKVIIELENRNKKIEKKYTRLKDDFSNLNEQFLSTKKELKELNRLYKEKKIEIEKLNHTLSKHESELNDANKMYEKRISELEEVENRNIKLEELLSKIRIHIIGVNENSFKESEYTTIFYSLSEIDKYIELSKINKNDKFLAYKFGVPTSILFKLKKRENIHIESNLRKIIGGI